MSYSLSPNSLLNTLLGDEQVGKMFSVEHDVQAMVVFEVALAHAQAVVGMIPKSSAEAIETRAAEFQVDMAELTKGFSRDGVAPPELVRQLRAGLDSEIAGDLHRGATSQDLIDTSLMMRLAATVPMLVEQIDKLLGQLQEHRASSGDKMLMARTRMQRALPISVGEKIDSWRLPLEGIRSDAPGRFPLQLGGPEGAMREFGEHAEQVREHMASILGLDAPQHHWQTDRRALVGLVNWINSLTTALGKLGQDLALMAQNEIAEVIVSSAGGSSAMPHKRNPILAEILVAIAGYSSTLAGGMQRAALHENERSGMAWTQEWLIVPQITVLCAGACGNAVQLLDQIEFQGSADQTV